MAFVPQNSLSREAADRVLADAQKPIGEFKKAVEEVLNRNIPGNRDEWVLIHESTSAIGEPIWESSLSWQLAEDKLYVRVWLTRSAADAAKQLRQYVNYLQIPPNLIENPPDFVGEAYGSGSALHFRKGKYIFMIYSDSGEMGTEIGKRVSALVPQER